MSVLGYSVILLDVQRENIIGIAACSTIKICLLLLYHMTDILIGTIVGLDCIGPLVTPTWNPLCWCSLSIILVWF